MRPRVIGRGTHAIFQVPEVYRRMMAGPRLVGPEVEIIGRRSFWKSVFFTGIGTVSIIFSLFVVWMHLQLPYSERTTTAPEISFYCGLFGFIFMALGLYYGSNNQPQVIQLKSKGNSDSVERLKKLSQMFEADLITEEDYNNKKAEILENM